MKTQPTHRPQHPAARPAGLPAGSTARPAATYGRRVAARVAAAAGRTLAALAAVALIACAEAWAATGNLRVDTPAEHDLTLTHAAGWSRTFAIPSGGATLWDLPAGSYSVAAGGVGAAPGPITIWDGLTTRIALDAAGKRVRVRDGCDDAVGALLLLSPEAALALPGDHERLLAALDTHTRWRPGAEEGDVAIDIPAERREILPGQREIAGPIALSSSPPGPQAGWSLWQITPAAPLTAAGGNPRLAATVAGTTAEGLELGGHVGLRDSRVLGVSTRGWMSGRFSRLGDAYPRSTGGSVLPHNDADVLDLVARWELGDATAKVLQAGTTASGRDESRWGLICDLSSRGWQRNHFLEEYRKNQDHAPFEETALFKSRAALTRRFGNDASGELWVAYERYLTWIGDGLYKKNLSKYGRPPLGEEYEPLIYWPAGDDVFEPTHVFEYFGRKYSSTWTAGLDTRRAIDGRTLIGLRAENSFHTYRRYEHFSPLDTWIEDLDVAYGRVLAIGYDATGREAHAGDNDPGQALSGRTGVWLRRAVGDRVRIDAQLGAHWLACDDSGLVSLDRPLAGGTNPEGLDAGDLRGTDVQIDPEAYLGLRWVSLSDRRLWAVGFRRMYDPPLEALFSPRAFLVDAANKEGVMGNPALEPEQELGVELGAATPLALGGGAWTLQASAHAGWLADAITMDYADLGMLSDADDERLIVPVYVNGGALRRYGLHVDATTGDQHGKWWLRVAYDLGRIESDSYEPPLLNSRWLDPDHPQGEYESEGLGRYRGGIYDAVNDDNELDRGIYRPSNLDRAHQVSLALIARGRERSGYADWFTALTSGWTKGVVVRLETGQPYTQTRAYAAGVLPQRVDGAFVLTDVPPEDAPRNGQRMPARFTVDLALTRKLLVAAHVVVFRVEALNLLGLKNAEGVYRATGEPDDDGCAQFESCSSAWPSEVTGEQYAKRITDPRHYSQPFQLRAGVSVQLY